MHPLPRRRRSSTILYHGRANDNGTNYVTISINGIRWEYFLNSQQCDTIEYLAKSVSAGKALAFAKSHATGWQCIDPPATAQPFARHRGAQASRAKRLKVSLPDV